ncbi:MAG: Sensory box histidine kinase/response regulator [Polyangiaceae bacterium]|jgi:signal transduction histidine kinase/CheY-like chemotaxis protein|nr:Sensory box histidine kinase/response regulator [Polyangiaceae bacterium]
MSLATVLSIAAAALELVIGLLALGFGRAPGWKHFQTFAWVAFSAAAYSGGDAVFASGPGVAPWVPWVGRLNLASALCHCGFWIVYCRVQYKEPLRRFDRGVLAVLGALAAAAFVPDLMTTSGHVVETVHWAAVTYRIPVTTPFGSLVVPFVLLALSMPAVTYFRKARRGVPGARAHWLGFSILYLTALNEVLVVLGVLDNLYLADLGFLAVVLSVAGEMMFRVAGDARRLQQLSAELSLEVAERTRELGETRDNLIRAERLAALGRLAASVGHEINNPLSYVVGNLEYLAKELEATNSPGLLEAVRDATSGASRIRRIVHELKVFARGSDQEKRELVDVREALDAAIKLVWGALRHRARLETNIEQVPRVLADSTRLTQVFVNVLMNALQAMPEERVGQADSLIRVNVGLRPDNRIAVTVTDNGRGIAPQDRPRLFEPFFSTKPQDQGSGLGLFVSFGIVTAIGGSLDVESALGVGTTVSIMLPPSAPAVAHVESVPSLPLLTARRRLLVVDDDVLVARTLGRLLKGHDVDVASSGRDALERLRKDRDYDLVLCDLMMPDLTGMDVFEEIERRYPTLADRVVFISGGGLTERSRTFIERHADRVLPKPIDSRQLAKLLAKLVPDSEPKKFVARAPVAGTSASDP